VKGQVPNVKLLLAGEGPLLRECKELAAQLGVEKMIDFLGYRKDIDSLLKMCDCAVGSSIREGLPVNIMEAMACGLPVVATDNRGHRELVRDQKNGWVIEDQNALEFASRFVSLAKNRDLSVELGLNSRNIILATYGIQQVLGEKVSIYLNYMNEKEGVLWEAH
jgi:glycosyltransferase EpsD